MLLTIKLTLCLCFLTATVFSQDRIRKSMVGPHDDQTRVVIAFTDILEDGYRLQSMIIDVTPAKDRKEDPSAVQLDLTSTVRSLSTGAKKQKILILRWKKSGELEIRCDGKWTRHEIGPPLENVVATTKMIIQSLPSNTKTPTEFTISPEVERKISSIFESLNAQSVPCLRELN